MAEYSRFHEANARQRLIDNWSPWSSVSSEGGFSDKLQGPLMDRIRELQSNVVKQEELSQARKDAELDLDSFVTAHWYELVEALQAHAEGIVEAHVEAIQTVLRPIEKEHDEITNTLAQIIGRTPYFTSEDIPKGNYRKLPVVNQEKVILAKTHEDEERAKWEEVRKRNKG
jgi:hypothetical protein